MEIPVVSRLYLTGAFLTTAACAVEIISPFSLYFNWTLVFTEGQVWRLITSYLFFGVFSVDFLFHMYFLVCNPGKCTFLGTDRGFIRLRILLTAWQLSASGSVHIVNGFVAKF